jgi:hypothetical protein
MLPFRPRITLGPTLSQQPLFSHSLESSLNDPYKPSISRPSSALSDEGIRVDLAFADDALLMLAHDPLKVGFVSLLNPAG